MEDSDSAENVYADAHLIAAAPDLLEALKRLLSTVEPDNNVKWASGSEVEQARLVICKAEGKNHD